MIFNQQTMDIDAPSGRLLTNQLIAASELPEFYERLDWEWFDNFTILTTNTATLFRLFITRQGKQIQDTNMEADGRLPRPEFFDLISVCVQPQMASGNLTVPVPNPPANLGTIETATLSLRVSSKQLIEPTPLWVFTAGSGVEGQAATSGPAATSFRFAENGVPTPLARWNTFVGVRIVYDEQLEVQINYDTAPAFGSDTKVFVYLAGIRYRASQ